MTPLQEIKKMICASIYAAPGNIKQLKEREFLKNYSQEAIDRLLFMLEKENKVYSRHNKYYLYKDYANSSEMSEYELN